jgi:hypothetical protein
MSRANPIQHSFNAGELSPRMQARVDRPQYADGCYRLRNFIPDLAGPAVKRGGTRFIAATKNSAQRSWFVRFQMSASESYILEFGHLYIRFFRNRQQILSGTPYEIASPWEVTELVNEDGSFALKYIQSGDVIYIASATRAPRKLSRFADTNWVLTTYLPAGGPFETVNALNATTVTLSVLSPTLVRATASAPLFVVSDLGRRFYLEQSSLSDIAQWEAGKTVAHTTAPFRRVGLRIYQATSSGTTGTVTPTHTDGFQKDGDTGVGWVFYSAGYGWGTIQAFQSSTVVDVSLGAVGEPLFPPTLYTAFGAGITTQPSKKWAFSAWSVATGYPQQVTFYYDRLVWGRGNDVWMTVAGDYENMKDRDEGGRQTVESAISIFIPSRRGSGMVWMEPLEQSLIAGTGIDEWLIAPASRNEPIGPLNISVTPLSAIGSRNVPVVKMFDSIIFAQRTGKRLRDLKYTTQDGLQRIDLNILADHILGPGVVSMSYAKEPNSLLMAARSDGKLAVAMFYPEQDLLGWALWETEGVIECVETIPSPNGTTDDVWMIVRRNVGGSDVRYIEFLTQPLGDQQQVYAEAFYVDCGTLTQPGFNQSVWPTAAPHLVGRTVNALGDGFIFNGLVVGSGGSITTSFPVFNLVVGLPYTATVATMDMEAGAPAGTAQNKSKRIHRMGIRLDRTRGGKAGPTPQKLDALRYTQPGQAALIATDLFTGDVDFSMRGGTEKTCRAWFEHSEPLPATVLAFIPQLQTDDIA